MIADEIVPGDRSGGTNTSHTIIVPALVQLLTSVDRDADEASYERAVLEDNVLGKDREYAQWRAGHMESFVPRSQNTFDGSRASVRRRSANAD